MALPASTIRIMHEIAGEERHPDSRLWMAALRLQSAIDWSLWVRRVDVALIGGDPIIIARRVQALMKNAQPGKAPRIAILHPGGFSGAPLGALEDPVFRKETGIELSEDIENAQAPRQIIRREIDRAAQMMETHGGGGVIAFEMVQALHDATRDEVVIRLTRSKGVKRARGVSPSAQMVAQVEHSSDKGRSFDLYARSEALYRSGLHELLERMRGILKEPPDGARFADLVIAKRCELLSGFISPPRHRSGRITVEEVEKIAGKPYCLAGPPPRRVSDAISFWRQDFDRAGNIPIS